MSWEDNEVCDDDSNVNCDLKNIQILTQIVNAILKERKRKTPKPGLRTSPFQSNTNLVYILLGQISQEICIQNTELEL